MSKPAIVITAVFTPAKDRHAEVVAALSRAIPRVHEELGCELYAIHDAPDGTVVMIEKWQSIEALEAHSVGEPVLAMRASLAGLLEDAAVVTRLVPIPVGVGVKGAL